VRPAAPRATSVLDGQPLWVLVVWPSRTHPRCITGRAPGPPPSLDEARQAFDWLLDAAIHGEMPPTETGLHPALIEAIEAVAGAWPRAASGDLIAQAHNAFARYERERTGHE
jgi:hypothetical protein